MDVLTDTVLVKMLDNVSILLIDIFFIFYRLIDILTGIVLFLLLNNLTETVSIMMLYIVVDKVLVLL